MGRWTFSVGHRYKGETEVWISESRGVLSQAKNSRASASPSPAPLQCPGSMSGQVSPTSALCSCVTEDKGLAASGSEQVPAATGPGRLGAEGRAPGLGRDTQDEDQRLLPGPRP